MVPFLFACRNYQRHLRPDQGLIPSAAGHVGPMSSRGGRSGHWLTEVRALPRPATSETIEQTSIPLARVFNLSLKEGVVPFEWKEANIIPLFKKGSRNKSKNYRPVSLTSVICKLLERLIKDHMVDFLVRHKLLNSSQHEFLKARSCLTNM